MKFWAEFVVSLCLFLSLVKIAECEMFIDFSYDDSGKKKTYRLVGYLNIHHHDLLHCLFLYSAIFHLSVINFWPRIVGIRRSETT